MRSGDLDKTITLQSLTVGVDAFGGETQTWTDIVTTAARVTPNRGNERFTAQQLIGKAVVTFKIRWRSGLGTTDRIVYDGRNYDIHDIRELGRREGLEIDASARSE